MNVELKVAFTHNGINRFPSYAYILLASRISALNNVARNKE
jgi:hypothetical protein